MLPHSHSLRLRHHRHTSYAGLAFLLLVTGIIVAAASLPTGAATNPQSGSVGLTGRVAGEAPTQAAVITSPGSGTRTSTIPLTVAGTCPANTFVLINKNGVLAGQAACSGGRFSLPVDLFGGRNELIAQVIDALGQYGPDSQPVTVTYDIPSATAGVGLARQMFLQADTSVVGVSPATNVTRSVTIVGGTAPYAVSWDFGDGATNVMSVARDGLVQAGHSYTQPGTYRVIVRVSDADGSTAFIQLLTVVNGPVAALASTGQSGSSTSDKLVMAWPLLGLAALMVLTFWIGERRGRARTLRRQRLGLMA